MQRRWRPTTDTGTDTVHTPAVPFDALQVVVVSHAFWFHVTQLLYVVVGELAELGIIDSHFFFLGSGSELQAGKPTREKGQSQQNDAGHGKRVRHSRHRVSQLNGKLNPVLVDPAAINLGDAVQMRNVVGGEETREQVAEETANAMYGEDVQGVIGTQVILELGGEIASNSRRQSIDDGRPGGDEARSRCHADQTADDARTEADSAPFLLEAVVDQTPSDAPDACGEVGHERSHDCSQVGTQCASRIEAKPADPEEDGADDNVGDIVRTVVECVRAMPFALAQNVTVGQRCSSTGDVHGSATSEVQTSQFI